MIWSAGAISSPRALALRSALMVADPPYSVAVRKEDQSREAGEVEEISIRKDAGENVKVSNVTVESNYESGRAFV